MPDTLPPSLPKRFDPGPAEARWYREWLARGAFRADPDDPRPAFSIVIPPPNVTGSLHLGHALNNTLQDLLARHKRLQGFNVLWLPGTDHAGISTQVVVEREIAKPILPSPCSIVGSPFVNFDQVLPPSVDLNKPLSLPCQAPFSHGPWRPAQRSA